MLLQIPIKWISLSPSKPHRCRQIFTCGIAIQRFHSRPNTTTTSQIPLRNPTFPTLLHPNRLCQCLPLRIQSLYPLGNLVKLPHKFVQTRHQRMSHLVAQIIYPLIGPILPPRPSLLLGHQYQRLLPIPQHRPNHIALLRPYPPPSHIHIPPIQIHEKMLQIIIRMMRRRQAFQAPLPHQTTKKIVPQIPRRHLNRYPILLAIPLHIRLLYDALYAQLLRQISHKLRIFGTLTTPKTKIHVGHHKRKARQSKQPGHHHRIHPATHRQQRRP